MFFKQFPEVKYSIENDGILSDMKDLYRYVDVVERSSANVMAYKIVETLDGERPDNLSQRLYGTPDYYWTFFITNDNLKDGIEAWPKAQNEVQAYIDNLHQNFSSFRFPYILQEDGQTANTLAGIPFQKEEYKDHLYLFALLDILSVDGELVKVYSRAKIIDYKPNLSQVWIDSSTINWWSDYEPYKEQIGDGGNIDSKYRRLMRRSIFYSGERADSFHIRFLNLLDESDEQYTEISKRNTKFIEEIRELGKKFRPTDGFDFKSADAVEANYSLTTTQYWELGKNAPAHYYNPLSIDESITEYESGLEATNYVSREQDILDDNDALRRIKYVSPQYIQAFALEYKKLINE